MKLNLTPASPWQLTVTTTGSAYAASLVAVLRTTVARAGLADRISLTREYRTVTAQGTVGALTYLLHSGRGLVLAGQAGHVAHIVLQPMLEPEGTTR